MDMLSVLKDRQSDGEKMKELHTSIKARNQRRKKRRRKDLHIRRSLLKSGQTDEKEGILAQQSCLLVDNQMKRKRKDLHSSLVCSITKAHLVSSEPTQ